MFHILSTATINLMETIGGFQVTIGVLHFLVLTVLYSRSTRKHLVQLRVKAHFCTFTLVSQPETNCVRK